MVNVESSVRGYEMAVVGITPASADLDDEDFANGFYSYFIAAKIQDGLVEADLTEEERGNQLFVKKFYELVGSRAGLYDRDLTEEERENEDIVNGFVVSLGLKAAMLGKELSLVEQSSPHLMHGYFLTIGLIKSVQSEELTLVEMSNDALVLGYRRALILLEKGSDLEAKQLRYMAVVRDSLSD